MNLPLAPIEFSPSRLTLSSFRLRSTDIERTERFYAIGLSMVCEKRVDLGRYVILRFSYSKSDVSLQFTFDRSRKNKLHDSSQYLDAPNTEIRPFGLHCMVMYVDDVNAVAARVASIGVGKVFINPNDVHSNRTFNIRAVTLLDPDGFRIALIENPAAARRLSASSSLALRIAHVCVPVHSVRALKSCVDFYKTAFSEAQSASGTSTRLIMPSIDQSTTSSLMDASNKQYRLLDSDSFAEEHDTRIWMGNVPRSEGCALCLFYRSGVESSSLVDRNRMSSWVKHEIKSVKDGTSGTPLPFHDGDGIFQGVEFTVDNLESALSALQSQKDFPVHILRDSIAPGLPQSFTFVDPAIVNVRISHALTSTKSASNVNVSARLRQGIN